MKAQRAWFNRILIWLGLKQKRLFLPAPLKFWEWYRICPKCLEKGKLIFMMEVFVGLTGGLERFMACSSCGFEYFYDACYCAAGRRNRNVMRVKNISGGYIEIS